MNTFLRSLAVMMLLACAPYTTHRALAQCAFGGVFWQNATPATCPGTNTQTCVWGGEYVLVNVVAGNTYTFSTCGGATWDTQITVFNNANGTLVGYNDDGCGLQSTVTWTATFTGTLRVLVTQFNCNANTTCSTLTITCAGGGPPPPPPPVCGSTVYDTGGPAGNYVNNQNYTVTYCPSVPGEVVTMNFTQFATEGCCDFLTIYNGNGVGSPVMGTFSGTGLPGSFTSTHPSGCITIQFSSDGSIVNTGWAATISCTSPPPPPTGDCVYVLTLQDSFGDGWGASSVGVSINGGANQFYTVGGFSNQILIGVNVGDLVVLTYNNSGPWQGENSFTLTLSNGGMLYSSGSPPAAGIVYAGAVDCIPPPAPAEDCIGGITVCSNQSISNNTNNTGNIADLTTFTAGCLANTERQGTWYNFSPSTSGTLAFAISPANPADDYDFALWGPYPEGSNTATICPPVGPPVRCSYAAPSGDTGLNFTATDLTEGAFGDKWVRHLDVLEGQVYLMYISNWSQSGLAFNLNFNPASTASLDCTLLPMELGELNAVPNASSVDLLWTTFSEMGTDHFIVERSADGSSFLPLGMIAAQVESQSRTDYRFVDGSPLQGLNFYRLVLVDQVGDPKISNVVSANFGRTQPVLVPNPVGDQAVLHVGTVLVREGTARITDASGRVVLEERISASGGQYVLDLQGVGQGAYTISLHGMDGTPLGHARFVKQ